ncbi:MAG: hypothetical protein FGM32_02935 [Candidatus Kapabacteria bacterium]|nr:hypothetical protein [Candidatus Kapabacteria bacterium]
MREGMLVEGLLFRHVLTPTLLRGASSTHQVVRYVEHGDLSTLDRGVYLIAVDDVIYYVGKFTQTFAKHWIYDRKRTVYHHKRDRLAAALADDRTVHVYAASEDELRCYIPAAQNDPNRYVNVYGIEPALIERLDPLWNVNPPVDSPPEFD